MGKIDWVELFVFPDFQEQPFVLQGPGRFGPGFLDHILDCRKFRDLAILVGHCEQNVDAHVELIDEAGHLISRDLSRKKVNYFHVTGTTKKTKMVRLPFFGRLVHRAWWVAPPWLTAGLLTGCIEELDDPSPEEHWIYLPLWPETEDHSTGSESGCGPGPYLADEFLDLWEFCELDLWALSLMFAGEGFGQGKEGACADEELCLWA